MPALQAHELGASRLKKWAIRMAVHHFKELALRSAGAVGAVGAVGRFAKRNPGGKTQRFPLEFPRDHRFGAGF